MSKQKKPVLFIAQGGLIAAIYLVLTFWANALGIGSMAIQCRFSELLTILPVFTPAAVPGLVVGCFLGNLFTSPLGPIDWFVGTAATLLAAVTGRALRKVRLKGLPVASSLMPVLFNAVLVGFEVACLGTNGGFSLANFLWPAFLLNILTVGLGELIMCTGCGLVLFAVLEKKHVAKRLFVQ